MKPQLHASALGMKCLEAFRRRYIEGEVIPPGIALIVGTGTHRAVERNLKSKMERGVLLPDEEVAETARDAVVSAWDAGVRLDPEEAAKGIKKARAEAVDRAVRLANLHHKQLAPAISPTAVERSWAVSLKGYPVDLVGQIDIQEAARIRDTKTSQKSPAPDAASKSLQLIAYSLAVRVLDGAYPQSATLDYLVDSSSGPRSVIVEACFDDRAVRSLLARVEALCRAMEAGIFPPIGPDHWACDPKWCGYAMTCKYYLAAPVSFAPAAKGEIQ
jgi:hypothetical protein